ncbi:MAG: GAF domain-containing protein [Gemmatimonadaceae bacterium]
MAAGLAIIDLELAEEGLEPGEALAFLTSQAQTLLRAEGACVVLLEESEYVFRNGVGTFAQATGPLPRARQPLASLASVSRHAVISNDARADPHVDARMVARFGARQVVLAPVVVDHAVVGALIVVNSHRGSFSSDEGRLLEKLAERAALVMRSSALLEHVERRAIEVRALHAVAVRKTRDASVLAAAARSLTLSVTPQEMYAEASRIAQESLEADGVEIYIAAPHARQAALTDGIGSPSVSLTLSSFWETADNHAVSGGHVQFRSELRDFRDEPGVEALLATGAVSGATLPLVMEGRPQGLIHLRFGKRQEFDADQRELLLHFSALIASALRNALLFAELERRATRLRAVAQVQRAITEVMALDEVYNEIYKAVASVVDSPCLVVMGYDEKENAFSPLYVVNDGVRISHDTLPHIPLASGATSQAFRTGEPNISARTRQGWSGQSYHVAGVHDIAVILSAPIIHGERVLGVIQAQSYQQDAYDWDDMDLIMLIARQAGTAIVNARLRDEERANQARQQTLATALEIMQQPIFILSAEAKIRYANSAAIREYQYSAEELLGMHASLLRPHGKVLDEEVAEVLSDLETGKFEAERVHQRKDGSEFPVLLTLSDIRDSKGDRVGIVASTRDLAGEKQAAEYMRHSERLAALGELVAGVAHELNNPLTGIAALAQILQEEIVDAGQTESVRMIKREVDRAIAVVRDLLAFAHKTGPRSVSVNINELVQQILRLRSYGLRGAGITVELDATTERCFVVGDDRQLQQVLLNIVLNAEHAMTASEERVLRIRTAYERNRIVIEISDTGVGMSAKTQKRIFEPFFTTKPEGQGTGLGLSVSYGILQAHGGTISVQSAPNSGTAFRISLPAMDPVATNLS